MDIIAILKHKFAEVGGSTSIKMLRRNKAGKDFFQATLCEEGIIVDNLGQSPLLVWKVFEKAIELLEMNDGFVLKGNGMSQKTPEEGDLNSTTLEAYIAKEVYGIEEGKFTFRRITPIVNILIWSGICENIRGGIKLIK